VLEFTTPKTAKVVQRDELFSLDGISYTIPKRFRAADALGYVTNLRRFGPDVANSIALEFALGEDGYKALVGAGDAITAEDIAVLVHVITSRILGQSVEVPETAPKAAEPEAPDYSPAEPSDEASPPE
jgi:hypothetical protein